MVRTVGGECTGSCRLGHVFLTSLFVRPPSRSTLPPPPLPLVSFSSFYSLFIRQRKERRRSWKSGNERAARETRRESERERRASSGRRWCTRSEGEGTTYSNSLALSLSLSLFIASSTSRFLQLGTLDAPSIITRLPFPLGASSRWPLLQPLFSLLLRLLLRLFLLLLSFVFSTYSRYLIPLSPPRTAASPSPPPPPPPPPPSSQRPSAATGGVHSQLHKHDERCRDTRLRFSRVKPSLIPGPRSIRYAREARYESGFSPADSPSCSARGHH